MNLKSSGTFKLFLHGGQSYLLMNPEATLMFVVSHVEVKSDSTTILVPLGNFNELSKARAAMDRDSDKRALKLSREAKQLKRANSSGQKKIE